MLTLTDVQNFLTEIFSQSSSPGRLQSLTQTLSQFEQEPTSWRAAIYFLSTSDDQHVCMFSLGILETAVRRWTHLTSSDRQEITQFLEKYAFLVVPPAFYFLRLKAVKVWTSLHKYNFSETNDKFFENLASHFKAPLSLESSNDLERLSFLLNALRSVYEELFRPDPVLTSLKVTELRTIVQRFFSPIISILLDLAEKIVGFELLSSSQNVLISANLEAADFFSFLRQAFLMTNKFLVSKETAKTGVVPALTKCFISLLNCFSELLASSQIISVIDDRFYGLIFSLIIISSPASLQAISAVFRDSHLPISLPFESLAQIGVNSFSCLQEIVDRKDVPRDAMTRHLVYIFRLIYLCLLTHDPNFPLQQLAASCCAMDTVAEKTLSLASNGLSEITTLTQTFELAAHDSYRKLADLLKILVGNFLQLVKCDEEVNAKVDSADSVYRFCPTNFLSQVLAFTFRTCKSMLSVYISCLDLWLSYLEYAKTVYFGDSVTLVSAARCPLQMPQSTQLVISSLCGSLVCSVFYSDSATFLDSLDDEDEEDTDGLQSLDKPSANSYSCFFEDSLQDDGTSLEPGEACEARQFMQASLSLMSAVAFFTPKLFLQSISVHLEDGLNVFSQLCDSETRLTFEEHTSRKLHGALRDLATSMKCLSFLSDHLAALKDPNIIRSLLQSLVFNFCRGVSLCDRLSRFRESLIRADIVKVLIENISLLRCLLCSGIIVSCDLNGQRDEEVQDCLILSLEERDSLVCMLLQCIHHLLFSCVLEGLSTVRVHASQLFLTMLTTSNPPGFFPPPSLLLSVLDTDTATKGPPAVCLQEIIASCCSRIYIKTFPIPIQRILVRAATIYLLTDEVPLSIMNAAMTNNIVVKHLEEARNATNLKQEIFATKFLNIFSDTISSESLKVNKEVYFSGLCWLNESLVALSGLGAKCRRRMHAELVNSGVLDRIWQCLDENLAPSVDAESSSALLIAHIAFFVQFTNVYGNSKGTAELIPSFVSAMLNLLRQLGQSMPSSKLLAPVASHLVKLLNSLVQNRNAFLPIASDVLRFCINCLLLNLVGGSTVRSDLSLLPNVVALVHEASRNDADLCLDIYELIFRVASYGFTRLVGVEQDFGQFLRFIQAIFLHHDGFSISNTRLVTLAVNELCDLNTRHRLFTLSVFVSPGWREQFSLSMLTLLVTQPQNDAADALIRGLYTIYLIHDQSDGRLIFQGKVFWECCMVPFLASLQTCLPSGVLEACQTLAQHFVSPEHKFQSVGEFSSTMSLLVADLKSVSVSGLVPLSVTSVVPVA